MKSNMENGDYDLSVLRTPIPTSVTGFMGVMKAFGEGTAEMRRVLERECDIIYECKVCRNIFRDVANLMTHKRLYCKVAFNSHRDFHFPDNGFKDHNISTIIEQEHRTLNIDSNAKREKSTNFASSNLASGIESSLPLRDLGGVVHKMRMKQLLTGTMKPTDYYKLVNSKVTLEDIMQRKHLVHLEEIPQTKVAVYQTVNLDNGDKDPTTTSLADQPPATLQGEPMKLEVDEVHKLSTKNDIVLGPDGKALKLAEFRDTVKEDFEIESLEELLMLCHFDEDALAEPHECAICDARFSTEKTLILHIRLKHISSTKVYQCPSCSQTFLQAALVIKHLSNDHKKSTKKIRSMRETIHRRHMRVDEVQVQVKGPNRELHRLQAEQRERIEAENNKAYLDNMANFDNTNQSMCTYCNKIFERKAVLTSHMANCRIKFEKALLGGFSVEGKGNTAGGNSGNSVEKVGVNGEGRKRGPKGSASAAKEKELIQDENSSSTVISSEGSNEASREFNGENSNGSIGVVGEKEKGVATALAATLPVSSSGDRRRKRKMGTTTKSVAGLRKEKKKEPVTEAETQHSKVAELLEKEIWTPGGRETERATTAAAASDDRDDSYFSFDDKAPEDARDEIYAKRRFPCDTCAKSFSTASNLKRHNVMFHYFQSRYQCRLCSYRSMKKKEAMAHLREEHQLDKEEHEMKLLLEQEKNEVSSSEVLDLDLEEGSSNHGLSRGRENSRTNSPVLNELAASSDNTSTPPSINSSPGTGPNQTNSNTGGSRSNSSSSCGIVSETSSSAANADTPESCGGPPRKRGRPKGSFKKKLATDTSPDRSGGSGPPRTNDSQRDSDSPDLANFLEMKKKTSSSASTVIPPLPPQVDNNSSSSSTSSRPIRNRTKPKDKDFVYDLFGLKGDFIYEDEAMDTAINESILAAANSSLNINGNASSGGTPETSASSTPSGPLPELNIKISKKRKISVDKGVNCSGESGGENPPPKRPGRPKMKGDRGTEERKKSKESSRRDSLTTKTNTSSTVDVPSKKNPQFNWEKNVIIPTRILEHRHSLDRPATSLAHFRKERTRRNSIEIMTKSPEAKGGNVKENNHPGNRHEAREQQSCLLATNATQVLKEQQRRQKQQPVGGETLVDGDVEAAFGRVTEEVHPKRLFVGAEFVNGGGMAGASETTPTRGELPILLNGRTMGEIMFMAEHAAGTARGVSEGQE